MKYERTHALDAAIEELIEREELFKPLARTGATCSILWFRDEGPLMCKGYPAAAMIRKTNDKERALGMDDAVMIIDFSIWEELTDDQQIALLAHELYHLEPIEDGGQFQPDPANAAKEVWIPEYQFDEHRRPSITMRKHDIEVGWFLKIAEKFGSHSQEVIQAKGIVDKHGQLLLFGDGTERMKGALEKLRKAAGKFGKVTVKHAGKTVEINGEE